MGLVERYGPGRWRTLMPHEFVEDEEVLVLKGQNGHHGISM